MLPRTLEPEVMDTPDEARDYDAMDHSTVNRVFAADFLKVWPGHLPVLDVGTGTAQIPIEVCQQAAAAGTTMGIHGIDLAEEMLQVGRENVRRHGLRHEIDLSCCDAKAMPFADEAFGAVISNSIVHHIPEPARVFGEMVRVVISDGLLFVRDLLRPSDPATLDRLVQLYAGDANEHQRKMFADSLRAALTLEEVRGIVAGLGFGPETVQQTSDRHWTWSAVKP
jgi:ubiquinone/menaquinone biosynthesis C-methylase UbiE